MSVKVFNISVPEELLAIIDQQVRLSFTNRNEYVKAAILTRLKTEGALGGVQTGHIPTLEELKKRRLREFLSTHTAKSTWDDLS